MPLVFTVLSLHKMLLEQAEVRCKQFQNCHFHHDIKNVILQAFVPLGYQLNIKKEVEKTMADWHLQKCYWRRRLHC